MSQTKEKYHSFALSRSNLWMVVWRWHGIPCVYCYYFCLELTVRKDTWVRTTCITVTVIFFESGILKVTWSQLCSKYLLNNYEPRWQQYFEIYPTVLYLRTWINMRAKSFNKTLVNVTETKIDEGARKRSVAQKAKRALGRSLDQNRNNVSLILCASFSRRPSL